MNDIKGNITIQKIQLQPQLSSITIMVLFFSYKVIWKGCLISFHCQENQTKIESSCETNALSHYSWTPEHGYGVASVVECFRGSNLGPDNRLESWLFYLSHTVWSWVIYVTFLCIACLIYTLVYNDNNFTGLCDRETS